MSFITFLLEDEQRLSLGMLMHVICIYDICSLLGNILWYSHDICDDTKQGANSLGLQVQSIVARVNFPHKESRGLYRTLGEQSKKLSLFFVKQPTKQFPCLVSPTPSSGCQAQGVNVSKVNMDMQ
jgi:hypothetical protein